MQTNVISFRNIDMILISSSSGLNPTFTQMAQMQTVYRVSNPTILPEHFQIPIYGDHNQEATRRPLEESAQLSSPIESNYQIQQDESIEIKHKLTDRKCLLVRSSWLFSHLNASNIFI